jgi:hypothetical protein
LTIGAQANILAIHDKLVRLIGKDLTGHASVGTHVLLQESGPESLRWSDAALDQFLETQVRSKFGVLIRRKQIRPTVNGSHSTIGDLSIAVSTAIQRQHRPKRNLVS